MSRETKISFRNIIFDWGGVMCSAGDHFSHPDIEKHSGLSLGEVRERANSIMTRYYNGKVSGDLFWNKLITLANLDPLTPEELKRAYFNSYKIYPAMFSIVKSLRNSFKVGILSNLTLDMALHIQKEHKLNKYFDCLVFSYQVGSTKPASQMYRRILKKMNLRPRETLFIDDSALNVKKARMLGMRGIVFCSVPQLQLELKRLGIFKNPNLGVLNLKK